MVEIYTLGNFDIRVNDKSILQSIGKKGRLIRLFKYLLTFQGIKLLPERIIEDLWQDEYKEPLSALRTQLSRIRNMFPVESCTVMPFFEISYIDGYYLFQLNENCFVDFVYMQDCMSGNGGKDCSKQMDNCKEVVKLYRGEYLGELGDEEWLVPVRNRFDRLFISSVSKYLQHLKDMGLYDEVLQICEDSMSYKPYEEALHIFYMDALANLGETKYAVNHYSYCTTKLYRELGEAPSTRMKELYKNIRNNNNHGNGKGTFNIDGLEYTFNGDAEFNGALVCDKRQFEFFHNYEKRIMEREKKDVFLGVITLDQQGLIRAGEADIETATQVLMDTIYKKLRKGDVLTRWNVNQALVLLNDPREDELHTVIERIEECFQDKVKNGKIYLNIKLKKI